MITTVYYVCVCMSLWPLPLLTQRHVVSLRGGSGQASTGGGGGRASHMRTSRSFIGSTPGEYVASLLRARDHEDRDCLPVLDLYG